MNKKINNNANIKSYFNPYEHTHVHLFVGVEGGAHLCRTDDTIMQLVTHLKNL